MDTSSTARKFIIAVSLEGKVEVLSAVYSRGAVENRVPLVHFWLAWAARKTTMLIPLFPLDLVLLPGVPLPLHIFEPRYKEMITECLEQKKHFGLIRNREEVLATVGCTAEILQVLKKHPDGR